MNKELENLKKSHAESVAKYKKTKDSISNLRKKFAKADNMPADPNAEPMDEMPTMDDMNNMCGMLVDYIDYVNGRVSDAFDYAYKVSDSLYSHGGSSHWPPLTPSQMNKALDKCGLAGDFTVMPKTIYASKNGKIEIEFGK